MKELKMLRKNMQPRKTKKYERDLNTEDRVRHSLIHLIKLLEKWVKRIEKRQYSKE